MKTFLALFMGSGNPADAAAFEAAPDRDARVGQGMAAWGQWMADHATSIVDSGGPVGKTKRTGRDGVSDISNTVGGHVVLQAESHEAAAQMFLNHPHFMIFPGDRVEIMERLPIPGQ